MDLENDLELERCDEELRRLDERRKKVVERKNRRIRQIREKQLKDKEAWMKKLIPLLDKTLQEQFGALYWYGCSAEDICEGVAEMKMPPGSDRSTGETIPEKAGNKGQRGEHQAPAKNPDGKNTEI